MRLASKLGNTGTVKAPLASDAKVNVIDKGGETPLDLAYQSGHTDIVKLLEDYRE
jgi:ankyrin repeat protein